MSRLYSQPTSPLGTTRPSSLGHLDLARVNSDSIFLLTLASSFQVPSTPVTPPTPSFARSDEAEQLERSLFHMFAEERSPSSLTAPVSLSGFLHTEEYNPQATQNLNTPGSRISWSSSQIQAVEVHRGSARVKIWMKNTFKKVIPRRQRDERGSRGVRMILD
ncbi:hypothetical protein FRB90_012805 [Tulasnella sp. 427]|nr:hypothetical protein FRB90_012805 [Tulasnella sp. 427]